jgi:hypothetical protein
VYEVWRKGAQYVRDERNFEKDALEPCGLVLLRAFVRGRGAVFDERGLAGIRRAGAKGFTHIDVSQNLESGAGEIYRKL